MSSFLISNTLAYRFMRTAILCLCVLNFSTQKSKAENAQETVRILTLGVPVKQEMAGGEVHDFRVSLSQGQYLRVVVEQQGINVGVTIFGPDKQELIGKDSPNGSWGPESISVIAQTPGDYGITLNSDKAALPGSYEIKVQELQEPTPENVNRVSADMAFAEGQKLRFQGTAESRQAAIEKYKEALALLRAIREVREEAYTLSNIGRTYKALGNLSEASNYLDQAVLLLRNVGDGSGQAFAFNEMGAAHRDLGNPLTAIEFYNKALALRRASADRSGEAQVLNNIGLIYARTGNQTKALDNYKQSLSLWQAVRDNSNEANTLNNIAGALNELGESAQALENFRQVLNISQSVGNKNLEAYARNNIGLIYDTWADSQAALDEYEKSLNIFTTLKNLQGEALVLDNIGMVYVGLGDTQRAVEFLNKSLIIREQLKEPRGKANTLTSIGYAYGMQGSHQEALRYHQLAVPFTQEAKDRKLEAYSLANAGMAYTSSGEPQKALGYFKQALDILKEIGDKRGQAIILDKMGQAYVLIGELTNASESYKQALVQWGAIGDKQGQALTLYGIAVLERNQNKLTAARDKIEAALSIIESLRTKMTSHQLRLNYLSAKHDYYGLYIDVRMQLYERGGSEADLTAALHASERARARNLLDLLTEAHAEVRQGVEQKLIDEERRLERELNAHSASLIRLRNQKREADAAVVEEKLNKLTEEYDKLQTRIRATSKSYAAIKQPRPLEAKEIQQQLSDDNTLLLEYALGDKRSYLWAVSRTAIYSYTLPPRSEIEKAALELRDLLTAHEPPKTGESTAQYIERRRKSSTQYQQRATELSRMVLGPAASQLGAKRLVIVPDGALQFIPFEALPAPVASVAVAKAQARPTRANEAGSPQLLVQRNEITYLPSATTLSLIRNYQRRPTSKTLAVIADPVFSDKDERIIAANKKTSPNTTAQVQVNKLAQALRDIDSSAGGYNLERLPHTLKEAKEAIAIVPAGSGMMAVGFAANRAIAMSQDLSAYRFVHFATHGLLDDKRPELSGIVLSMVDEQGQPQDGFLQLHDIYNLHLPVDLVVLSACRTGIGKQVTGEGLIGLTRGFMSAGAAGVVASLWKVDDEATAALMERFYWHLIKERKSPSAALKAAKEDIMRARRQWREPFYWAGFVLQGDWK